MKRNWREYSKELLLHRLSSCEFDFSITNVQQFWNNLENNIINVIDDVTPMVEFTNNYTSTTCPKTLLKPLINEKRRLLKLFKNSKNQTILENIKEVNKSILEKGKQLKRNSIRRSLVPGNSKSLWNAVNLAKDINPNVIPQDMSDNGTGISPIDLSDAFAEFFDKKVKSIVDTCRVDENVYNGTKKVRGLESNFMTTRNVCDALNSIKIKNCEGYDRIPQ